MSVHPHQNTNAIDRPEDLALLPVPDMVARLDELADYLGSLDGMTKADVALIAAAARQLSNIDADRRMTRNTIDMIHAEQHA